MNTSVEGTRPARVRFWSRLLGLGLLRQSDVVQVHRIAQQNRILPEQAAVLLGLLTARQIQDLAAPEAP